MIHLWAVFLYAGLGLFTGFVLGVLAEMRHNRPKHKAATLDELAGKLKDPG